MVSLRGLSHSFGDRAVLKNIDLEVASGEVLAIMGSSGGGKTTLLRCVSGLLVPTKGEVIVDDIDVRQDPEEARRHMGMVFQSAALFDYMTVEENVLFGIRRTSKLDRKAQRALMDKALLQVGLEPEVKSKMPAELSGGMRKRVGIARAVALRPKVMLYDEPTTGLDPITTYTIDALVGQLRRELGVTSVVVSHDVTSVLRTADRVAFLHQGEVVFNGSGNEFQNAKFPAIRELLDKATASSFT